MGQHLLLYDGLCGLCTGVVQFVLKHDTAHRFDFAALQSGAAHEALRRFAVTPDALDTFYVVADYRSPTASLRDRAAAALFLARTLGWPWRAAAIFRILPGRLLNAGYALVARTRYRVFGRRDACLVPGPDDRTRFIDQDEVRRPDL